MTFQKSIQKLRDTNKRPNLGITVVPKGTEGVATLKDIFNNNNKKSMRISPVWRNKRETKIE